MCVGHGLVVLACNFWSQHYRKGLSMKTLMLILLTVAAAIAGVGWTTAAFDDTKAAYKKELERLAGTWQIVAMEKVGVPAPEADFKQMKYIIIGDKYTVELDGKTVEEGWICIDPTRKPKGIDVYPTKPEGKVEMGIYEWDGDDKIKVCVTDPGTEQYRPRLFSTTKGTGHVLTVGKREKAK
jgi:uncharacterized protein (TIGR03067 family)